ncbi:MAG: hypothetical protein NVS3B7_14980 [Candidatus Elarobacter sp.]
MEFVTDIVPADLVGIRLIAESDQFAVYATGESTYLLVQRHSGTAWTGLLMSGDGVFRMSAMLGEATRDLYRDLATRLSPANKHEAPFEPGAIDAGAYHQKRDTATERRELYQDDLTEERQISPVLRDIVASTIVLDP